jgi:hypothetical protein
MVTESLNWTIDLPPIIIMRLRAKKLYLLYFSEVFEFNSISLQMSACKCRPHLFGLQ